MPSSTTTSSSSSSSSNRHLLAYSVAGMLGMAYYYWKHQNRHEKRKDGDATVLYSDREWDSLLRHYNQMAGVVSSGRHSTSGSNNNNNSSSSSHRSCIYLDYNGTTPVYPPVLAAMLPYFTTHYGNPSSGHALGREPRRAVDEARTTLLTTILGVADNDNDDNDKVDRSAIWFTACGTEADNLAIHLALQSTAEIFRTKESLPHIVTSNVEHPAIEVCLRALEDEGRIRVTYVPVQTDGCVRARDMIDALTEDTILVTLMLANNESGALQPVRPVAEVCRQRGILVHTDAAQAGGKVSCRLDDLGHPDMVSLVGHKIGAPKGIACLYVRPQCYEEAGRSLSHHHGILLLGGGQEHGRRGGTENTPYIVGMAVAAAMATTHLAQNAQHMEAMRSRLLAQLEGKLEEAGIRVRANGPSDPSKRLPNTLSVGLENIHSGDLLAEICDQVAASAGATCHSAAGVSSVLRAMKVPEEFARGTLRLSVGPKTTPEDIDQAAELIAKAAIDQSQMDTI